MQPSLENAAVIFQAKHFGLMTVGLDAAGILDMIKEHVKKAQTSEVDDELLFIRQSLARFHPRC